MTDNCYYFEEDIVKLEGGHTKAITYIALGHTNVYELLLHLAVD